MEFDEHDEEQEEELGSQNYQDATPNEGGPLTPSGGGGRSANRSSGAIGGDAGGNSSGVTYRYKQCMKNHAVGIGLTAVDGCGEFIAAGEDGTLEALRCAACNCHRNFHRKELVAVGFHQYPSPAAQFPPYFRASHPSGFLNITPPPRNMAVEVAREDDDMSNPSSSGGGGSKKRHRTKFTQEQKAKMLAFAEKLGWRFQKQDEDAIGQFCNEINVNRQVFKVWMHNNKHTMGKKL